MEILTIIFFILLYCVFNLVILYLYSLIMSNFKINSVLGIIITMIFTLLAFPLSILLFIIHLIMEYDKKRKHTNM